MKANTETVWTLCECGGGARWSFANLVFGKQEGEICSFSDCGCETPIKHVKKTSNREEAYAWFKRPEQPNQAGLDRQLVSFKEYWDSTRKD